jgi:hypothetical protein
MEELNRHEEKAEERRAARPPVPLQVGVTRVTVDIPGYLQPALAEMVVNENSTPEAIMLAALECYVAEYLPKVVHNAPFDPS